ncbi:GNAT family N-acetyltransferase [Vibrio fluvialis]|uniref:GNAT family N-acetyltransferase n=1 Tax=Vibrio fluvialis TaxID=676 RepID=UPI001ED937FF|nr:GNAT family N-acetyltransferase [Vibrio fluvialis]WDY53527.1 GNAT family N-acetyltransferase [Vibrio fluvialis]
MSASLVVGLQFILFDKYLRDMPLKLDIVFTFSPSDEEIDRIYQGLKNFNQRAVPEVNDETFAILVRDEQGNVVGGLTGVFFITSVQVRFLWLSEAIRKQGIGNQLISQLELMCAEKKIGNIMVDTYTYQAPLFYESHGFEEIGRYKDYLVEGVDKIFYQKRL